MTRKLHGKNLDKEYSKTSTNDPQIKHLRVNKKSNVVKMKIDVCFKSLDQEQNLSNF